MCIAFLACLLPVFLIIIICSLFKHHVCYSNHCKSQHPVLYLSLLVKTLFGVIYCFNFPLSFSLHQNSHYPIMWTEFLVQNSLHVINWGPSLWPILLISSAAVHPLIDVTWISRVWIWISLCYRSSHNTVDGIFTWLPSGHTIKAENQKITVELDEWECNNRNNWMF